MNPATGAQRFHDAISAAKTGKYAAAVHVYPPEDYRGMRLFVTPDNSVGFALKGDDIVSAFKNPDSKADGAAHVMLALAAQQGGRRLDAFDTVLPELYSKNGFRAVARLAWDDSQKPPDWSYETFQKYNGGRPDVVFMVYDPAYVNRYGLYTKTDGARVQAYDDGTAAQKDALKHPPPIEPPPPSPPAPPARMSKQEIESKVASVAKDLDYDPAAVFIFEGTPPTFELNGKQYKTAGLAHTSNLDQAQPISLYSQNITPSSINGLISHEIEHIKFETAWNAYQAELRQVVAEPRPDGSRDPVMFADGRLKPPYDEKYPAYTAMHAAYFGTDGIMAFAAADGVSEYSYDWWRNWKDRGKSPVDAKSAVHETLAEMAAIKYTTGKFPSHMGEKILSWRGENTPKPSQAQMDKNAKLWRDLYRAIDKVWKLQEK